MKDILIDIEKMADDELERANKTHPLFVDNNHGYGVIREEVDEAIDNVQHAVEYFEKAWTAIKRNDDADAVENIALMKQQMQYAAAEMVQVIAMCEKFVKSQEARKWQQK